MKGLFKLAILAVIAFAVVGYYLDWYSIERTMSDSGKETVEVTFHKDKIKEDAEKAEAAAKEVTGDAKESVATVSLRGKFDGVITSISSNTVRVKTDSGIVSVPVSTDTNFKVGGKDVLLSGFAVGDQVTVRFPEGNAAAKSIKKSD